MAGVEAETVAEAGVEAEAVAGSIAEAEAVILLSVGPGRRLSSVACIDRDNANKIVVCGDAGDL
jgi:hypothetical protein